MPTAVPPVMALARLLILDGFARMMARVVAKRAANRIRLRKNAMP